MPSAAFISYSHRDEKILDRLHKHLAMLRREGSLAVWHDRQIEAGGEIDAEIQAAFTDSDLFLAMVSPDFLNSTYCYEKEMLAALERHDAGTMTVVPIILETCDWKSSPLAKFKALPKDGVPISEWTNENVAFLDIVTELRRIVEKKAATSNSSAESPTPPVPKAMRAVRLKRDFDSIERADFRDSAFATIQTYFERSVTEINQIGEPLRAKYESMSPTAFTCTIVNRAKRNGEASITVHNHKARSGLSDITYTHDSHGASNHANGMIAIQADEYQLYLLAEVFGRGDRNQKLSAEQVAEKLWTDLTGRAGIDYA